jgi:site-specific recombinase XerD
MNCHVLHLRRPPAPALARGQVLPGTQELKAHPHMLRHACGYALANKGHDTRAIQAWLGHRSITSTAAYTALAPNRFKDFWRE